MSTRRRRSARNAAGSEESSSDDEAAELPQVIERRGRPAWHYAVMVVCVISMGIGAGYCLVKFFDDREPFVPRPMTPNMPTVQCRPVGKEDIQLLSADKHWQHTLKSMYWHMNAGDLEGISAFHVGDPTCFILVRTSGGILPMFNTMIKGYSPNSIVTRDEESLACPGVIRNMMRAMHIRVSYIDADTREDMTERFSGVEALAIQHVNFYSLGKTICDLHASNTDQGVATLRKLIASDTFS